MKESNISSTEMHSEGYARTANYILIILNVDTTNLWNIRNTINQSTLWQNSTVFFSLAGRVAGAISATLVGWLMCFPKNDAGFLRLVALHHAESLGKSRWRFAYSEGPLPPWIMNLNDGCRMEGCLLIVTAWYGLHFARNHSTLGAYSRVQWILSPRTVHWFFFRDALRNSFGSEDPHFPRHIQNFAKPETSFGWEIQKPRQQHNQLLHYEQLKARRGVAMLVMSHTKVIVTSAKTSMSL